MRKRKKKKSELLFPNSLSVLQRDWNLVGFNQEKNFWLQSKIIAATGENRAIK